MPATIDGDIVARIKKQLDAGEGVTAIAKEHGVGKATVYRIKERSGVAPPTALVKRSHAAIEQPEEIEAEEVDNGETGGGDEEVNALRSRCADLTDHIVDLSMENARLRRALQAGA